MNPRWIYSAVYLIVTLSLLVLVTDIRPPVYAAETGTSVLNHAEAATDKAPDARTSESAVSPQPTVKKIWSFTLGKMVWALVIFLIALYSIRALTKLLETLAEKMANYRLSLMRVIPVIRIGCWTGTIYFIIGAVLAPPVETLMALAASAGIALGFASQDILKNIFGGLMILMDHPFQVGDKIQIRDHYGEVLQIGLRSVKIVTPDDSVVTIPNSDAMNQAVINANSGESNCQVVTDFFLPVTADIKELRTIAMEAAGVSKYIYLAKPIAVVFKNEMHHDRSLLKMRIKAYVLDIRYEFAFASEMTELVLETLNKRGLLCDGIHNCNPPSAIH